MNRKLLIHLGVLSLVITAWSTDASAQQPKPDPWVFTVDGGLASQSEVDLDDDGQAFSVDRWFASAGVQYQWSFRDAIGVSVGTGRSDYDFADGAFGGNAPWGKIEDHRLALTGRFGWGERATVLIIPTVRHNGEEGASSSDSRNYGLFTAAAWRLSEDLTIGPGFGIFSRLEDGTRFFPILAIDWNITERWNLSTGRGLAASQGPGLTLSYELSSKWSFGLTGRYEDIEFRLAEDSEVPGGIGRDQSLPMVLSARYEPNRWFNASVFMGAEFAGNLELQDSDGRVLQDSDYDTAGLFGATFELRF